MKINAVITTNKFKKNKSIFKDYGITITTVLILVLSVAFGVVYYMFFKDNINEELSILFNDYTSIFVKSSKPSIISGLLSGNIIYFLLMLLFSTSVIGIPFLYFFSATRMIGLGTVTAYIYSTYGLKGIEYCALIFFPGKLFLILAVLILTDSCIYMCRSLRKNQNDDVSGAKKSVVRIIFVLIFIILSVLFDFFTITLFSGLFDF